VHLCSGDLTLRYNHETASVYLAACWTPLRSTFKWPQWSRETMPCWTPSRRVLLHAPSQIDAATSSSFPASQLFTGRASPFSNVSLGGAAWSVLSAEDWIATSAIVSRFCPPFHRSKQRSSNHALPRSLQHNPDWLGWKSPSPCYRGLSPSTAKKR
jgi:hypothetical protein